METHSSNFAWSIPWAEEPGRLQSMGSQELDKTQRLNKPIREGNGNPLQYCHSHSVFLPEKAHGERNLVSCSPWDPKDSDATEHTSKGDTFSCHTWVGWPIQWVRSQRCCQTSIPHCTRPPPHQKIILPQMAIFLRLRTTASVGIH